MTLSRDNNMKNENVKKNHPKMKKVWNNETNFVKYENFPSLWVTFSIIWRN